MATSVEAPTAEESTNVAKEKAIALKDARAYPVKDWHEYNDEIPRVPGIYMFSEGGRRLYVGVGAGSGGIRGRLSHQVRPGGIGDYSWTGKNPPPKGVRNGRNLLYHVLRSNPGPSNPRPASESQWWPNADDITALNEAFRRIHGMTVRWVECPNKDTATRAEHCAICLLQPEFVAK